MTRPDYVPDDLDANSRIAKEGYYERKRKSNPIQRKLHELAEKDEQKRITKHSEGFCYGCNRTDYIISTLYYICDRCYHKRGKEGLLAVTTRKPSEEICDFCGYWQRPFGTCQINCSLCDSCRRRIETLHEEYRRQGGKKQHPFRKRMLRKFGKDYNTMLGFPHRKIV